MLRSDAVSAGVRNFYSTALQGYSNILEYKSGETAPIVVFELSQAPCYFVRVSRRGPPAEPFGWKIYSEVDSVEMHRSTQTFATRIEALLDSVRTAAAMAVVLVVERSSADCKSGAACAQRVSRTPKPQSP
jgi:hypothetical protein